MSSSSGEMAAKPSTKLSFFNIVSDFSIVAVHLIAVVIVVDWVTGSLLGGGAKAYTITSILFGIPALVACWFIMRMAIRTEKERISSNDNLNA